MDLNEEQKIIKEHIEQLKNLKQEDIEKIISSKQSLENPIKENEIKKITDSPHEIVFSINAHVLMQNDAGELTGTKEICVKNYHIPVPIDKDYHNYMKTFFDYLEKKILDTIQDTNKDAMDKEEKPNE